MMTKADLFRLLAASNRGLSASNTEQIAISAAIADVETSNPTLRPLESALLGGDWRLIYTTSASLLNLGRLPLSDLGQIYQCIRLDTSRIYNIAEIQSLPYLSSLVSVVAKFQLINERRVQVNFERSIVGLQNLLGYQSPAAFIDKISSPARLMAIDFPINSNNRDSWLDITYLDENLRISRGNQGSVFVLTKDQEN
jgi:PAP_fibrillin